MKTRTREEIRKDLAVVRECGMYENCTECPHEPEEGECTFASLSRTQRYLVGVVGQLLDEQSAQQPAMPAPLRLFVSQPMAGRSRAEILSEREEAVRFMAHMTGREIELLDSYWPDFDPAHPLQYLARSLAVLAEADWAYFAEGWDMARGCMIEKECAEMYDIDHITC